MVFLIRLFSAALSRWLNIWYRSLGVRLLGYVWLRKIDIPRNHRSIQIGAGAAIDDGVVLLVSGTNTREAVISIGERVYLNRHCFIDAADSVTIAEDAMIGPFCYITDHDHTRGPDSKPASGDLVTRPTTIGARCWIGAHVCILKGVEIGEGSTVGAGSVVTRSVPAGSIAVGNPARVIS